MNTQGSNTGVRRTEVANEEMVGINDQYTEQHDWRKERKGVYPDAYESET